MGTIDEKMLFLIKPQMLRNDPYSMYDTAASGNWYKADEPWGAFLQTDGNPAVTVHPYESDPSSGSFNPQAHTTWVPVDWNSWPNYNVTATASIKRRADVLWVACLASLEISGGYLDVRKGGSKIRPLRCASGTA